MPEDHRPSGSQPDGTGGPTGAGNAPPALSRQELRRQAHGPKAGWSRARWYTLCGAAIVAVAGLAVVLLAQGRKEAAAKAPAPTTTSTAVPAPVAVCPLTG